MTEEKKQKFYIDMKKLHNNNILCIKYYSTKNFKLSPISINNDVKNIILDIVKNDFNKRLYDKLNEDEQKIILRFVNIMDYNINIQDNGLEKLYNQFEILRGEYLSGNDSIIIKKQLRKYIIELVELK